MICRRLARRKSLLYYQRSEAKVSLGCDFHVFRGRLDELDFSAKSEDELYVVRRVKQALLPGCIVPLPDEVESEDLGRLSVVQNVPVGNRANESISDVENGISGLSCHGGGAMFLCLADSFFDGFGADERSGGIVNGYDLHVPSF